MRFVRTHVYLIKGAVILRLAVVRTAYNRAFDTFVRAICVHFFILLLWYNLIIPAFFIIIPAYFLLRRKAGK